MPFHFATKPWAELPESAREKFTGWLETDPTGQAVAAETNGDMDYAVWLIGVELTCHQLFGKPYTAFPHADWRTSYNAGHSLTDTVRANARQATAVTTAVGGDPLAAARHAVYVTSTLTRDHRFHLRDQTCQNPDNANDIRAYLDTQVVEPAALVTLVGMGIATSKNCTVAWATQQLRPLTRFGLLVRSALLNGCGHVIEGAQIETAARTEWEAHRHAPDHDPATCGWAKCAGEQCYWPLCESTPV